MLKGTCPECGYRGELVAFFVEDEARQGIAEAARLPAEIGPVAIRYLGLFRPPAKALALAKATRLLRELADAVEAGRIERRGRHWPAPVAAWRQALDTLLEARPRLVLPLKNHHYLYEIVAGLAHQSEGVAERETEARRRRGEHRPEPPPVSEPDTKDPQLARDLLQAAMAKLQGGAP